MLETFVLLAIARVHVLLQRSSFVRFSNSWLQLLAALCGRDHSVTTTRVIPTLQALCRTAAPKRASTDSLTPAPRVLRRR